MLNGIAVRVGREDDAGRLIRSRHPTRPLWQLDDNYDHSSADAQQPAAQVGTETQALHRPGKADSEHGKLTPRDPNIVGFVPAYILGNVYMCKLPDRYSMLATTHLLRLSVQSIAHQPLRAQTTLSTLIDDWCSTVAGRTQHLHDAWLYLKGPIVVDGND